MPVHFSQERMAQAVEAHTRWWAGTLDRPLTSVIITDAYPTEKRTPAPVLSQKSCAQLEWTAEQVIEATDEALSRNEYLGDSYPMVNLDSFGPGVLAALCDGAKLDNSSGGVWFFPAEEKELCDIHVRYNPENLWARRIKDLYRAGRQFWGDSVVMSMPDLGGVMDVLASLRGSENLLMDLYDCPEEVKRIAGEVEIAWQDAYADFRQAMGDGALYTDWNGILSTQPSYILQCDFSYMISNAMFREFVLETLRRDTERLANTIYHLDGVGELNHLDDLCSLERLRAVQWVFGEGKPGPMHWLDVYRRIMKAGKQVMIVGEAKDYPDTLHALGGTPYARYFLPASDRALAEAVIHARTHYTPLQ